MVQTTIKSLSLEAFLKLPETQPASEYIDGKVIQKSMPKGKHSVIQTQLSSEINTIFKQKQIAWAFAELRCTFGDRSIVPDISVFTWSRIPCDENDEVSDIFLVAPDWVIEVLSPDQSQTKVTKNILHCLKYGTQIAWLIDSGEQTILVYLPPEQLKIFDKSDDKIPVPAFANDFQLTVGEIFKWLSK